MAKLKPISRKEYEKIKRMDHGTMTKYINQMYMNGYDNGKKEADGLNETEIKEAVLNVKGIGEKKANDIMNAIINANKEKRLKI